MPFKFVANVSRLFPELPFLDRFQALKDAGFDKVEITTPLSAIGCTLDELNSARTNAGVEIILMNACCGVFGQLGISAMPNEKEAFKSELDSAIDFAKVVGCKRLHLMAGRVENENKLNKMRKCYISNLRYAAEKVKPHDIKIQIEFIAPLTIPKYFLNSGKLALEMLKELACPNIELQLDIFHLQMTEGNLTESIELYLKHTSYIQVSQAPKRGEPSSKGEINYIYIFDLLKDLKFDGYVGLEYSPEKDTLSSLNWIKDWGLAIY